MPIVLDASAAVDLLLPQSDRSEWVAERVARAGVLVAPHVIDVELLSALRGLALGGDISERRGARALADFKRLRLRRYPTRHLLDRVWELRHRLTAYDAAYVALAELLHAPLVTTDARLARARGHRAEIVAHPG